MKKDKEFRTRNWASVIYPESAEPNWRQLLRDLVVPALVSPLHDKDFNEDMTLKKPHYHIMTLHSSPKTKMQAEEVFNVIGAVGAEPIRCCRAYTRYLTHMDSPEKAQYSENEIESFSGADYTSLVKQPADKYTAISEMIDYCESNSIYSYAELIMYSKSFRQDWFRVLCDNGTLPIVQFLKSKHWTETQLYGK